MSQALGQGLPASSGKPGGQLAQGLPGVLSHRTPWFIPLAILVFGTALGGYFVLRYGGNWGENDTLQLVISTQPILQTGHLLTPGYPQYGHGYGLPALAASASLLTGVDLWDLQTLIFPLLIGFIGILSFILFRSFTGDTWSGATGALLLLLQPEFLFVIFRGSHEKFLRSLMLLSLFLLVRSFQLIRRPRDFGMHVFLFYLVFYSMVTFNMLLGNSFIAAVAVGLVGGIVISTTAWRKNSAETFAFGRLAGVASAGFVIVFLLMEYIYPPAGYMLDLLPSFQQRAAALLLDVQANITNPYTVITTYWIGPLVYLVLTLPNWLILLGSAAIWLYRTWRWWWYGESSARTSWWLLWALWLGFAVQGAIAVFSDATGFLGSNLQLRLYPSFSIVAVGIVATALGPWLRDHTRRISVAACTAAAAVCLTMAALLKATNEPALSNYWIFVRPEELAAVSWAETKTREATLWTEYDARVADVAVPRLGLSGEGLLLNIGTPRLETRDFMVSEVTRLRSARLKAPLPGAVNELRVYDNGLAQIFHLQPRTPYQR